MTNSSRILTAPVGKARHLRRRQTVAEKELWQKLRAGRFHGLKFRRQAPIDPYIVDFYCSEKRLVIEIDGSVHFEDQQAKKDRKRTAFLQDKGLRVVRFTNTQVRENIDWVLEEIAKHCAVYNEDN